MTSTAATAIATVTVTVESIPLDQLINSCRTYMDSSANKDRVYTLSEWVIQAATGLISVTDKEIEAKFTVARIWGANSELKKIRAQLEAILKPTPAIPQVVIESSGRIDKYQVDIVLTFRIGDSMNTTSYPIRGGGYVFITPCISSRFLGEIGERLSQLSIVDSRHVTGILREVLGLGGRSFGSVPRDKLVNLGIYDIPTLHLLKGTDGLLVSVSDNACDYVGQLNSDCRGISSDGKIIQSLDLCCIGSSARIVYSERLSEYTSNTENHQRLIELVRAHVSNSDEYRILVKIKYSVRTDTLEEGEIFTDRDDLTYIELAYQNYLVVTPSIADDELAEKVIDYAVDNKNLSIKTLIKNVEVMLNA